MPASRWSRAPTCSAPRVQMAARLCDAAAAGAILVSRELRDRAGVADDATPLWLIALKGFAGPVPVFSIGWQ